MRNKPSETRAELPTSEEVVERSALPTPDAGSSIALEKTGRQRAGFDNYYRWLRVSRLAVGSFIFMSLIALLWLIPWTPAGLDPTELTPQVGFTVYLLASCAVLGMIALILQDRTRRTRESIMVWSTVYDEVTGLHNRTYLFDRIALECDRAKRSGEVFSVIVLQLRAGSSRAKNERKSAPLSNSSLRKMAEVIDSQTHPTDMVALLSSSELAVLANRIGREARQRLQARLRDAVAAQIRELGATSSQVDVKAGVATFGVDGTEPAALIQAARTSATLRVRTHTKAA